MEVKAAKLTDIKLCKEMLEFVYGIKELKMSLGRLYFEGHSIERTQLFLIFMKDVPHKVAMQLRTCAGAGQFHLISSKRADWNHDNGEEDEALSPKEWDESQHRLTLQNHLLILNSTLLKNMIHLRLCSQAEQATK